MKTLKKSPVEACSTGQPGLSLRSGLELLTNVGQAVGVGWTIGRWMFRQVRFLRNHRQASPEALLQKWVQTERQQRPPQFLLSVGITDYSMYKAGKVNSLPWCADDARQLSAAFSRSGGVAATLTDSGATGLEVERWFRWVTAEAKKYPNAVVWFFYSGHGVRSRPTRNHLEEADDRQDAILLADGPLVDDTLARLLARLPKGTPLVTVFDSCHSGGLMPEVMSRSGPMLFLASSDEDATSQVATEYHAGGYLSHLLIRTLAGIPPGTGLTAGELQDRVYEEWSAMCRHHESIYQTDGETTWGRQWPTLIRTCKRSLVVAGG